MIPTRLSRRRLRYLNDMNTLEDALKRFMESNPDIETVEDHDDVPADTPSAPTRYIEKNLHVIVERKGRAGKTATIITDFTMPDEELQQLARELKTALGTGGSVRGNEILIQGDRKARVVELLRGFGHKVKG